MSKYYAIDAIEFKIPPIYYIALLLEQERKTSGSSYHTGEDM